MSNEPPRNPFAAPDPNRPAPPPTPTPERDAPAEEDSAGGSGGSPTPPGRPDRDRHKPPKGEGTPPSMEELKEASSWTFRFGGLLILALLASQLPLPYTLAAPVVIIGAIVFGIFAIRRSWAISSRNLMTPMLIAGIVMALMMSVTVASKFALWPVEMEHQECLQYAITNSAKAECEADYEQGVADRLDSLRGSLPTSE